MHHAEDSVSGNPLYDGRRLDRPPEPTALVIFGATGDLTSRKLVPALYSLAVENRLPANYQIVGFSRSPWSHDEFRTHLRAGALAFSRYPGQDSPLWDAFAQNLFYVSGHFGAAGDFERLDTFLAEQARLRGTPDNRLYYLAAPPQFFEAIVESLGHMKMGHDDSGGWRRIIIEKPFGHDLGTARALNRRLQQVFHERQIYRIDHYLGKETVQNLLVLRFANAIFEPIWNRNYIDHVQISVAEAVGIGNRAGFYDQAGVIRDIFQNHLLQLLTLVAMEPPVAFEADAVRDEKVKVLRAMQVMSTEETQVSGVRAQYTTGVIDGERVPAYVDEPNVPPTSQTPTYAALKWYVDNWRWQGVPFYVRSGKRLVARATEISIHFKCPPYLLFGNVDRPHDGDLRPNVLAMRIQPDEGIAVRFEVKVPGQGMDRRSVAMDFRYGTSFGTATLPDAYERLLLDAMLGDATLFTRSDEIEHAWALIDPLLAVWESEQAPPLERYEAGTWGPDAADRLIEQDGRQWRRL